MQRPEIRVTKLTVRTVELAYSAIDDLDYLFKILELPDNPDDDGVNYIGFIVDALYTAVCALKDMLERNGQGVVLRRIYHPHAVTFKGNINEPYSLHESFSSAAFLFAREVLLVIPGTSDSGEPLTVPHPNSQSLDPVHGKEYLALIRNEILAKRFEFVRLKLFLQRELEAVSDLLDTPAADLSDVILISRKQISEITMVDVRSFRRRPKAWGAPVVGGKGKENGRTADLWDYQRILPILKRQFPGVKWPNKPPQIEFGNTLKKKSRNDS